jgi:hypothetical protein
VRPLAKCTELDLERVGTTWGVGTVEVYWSTIPVERCVDPSPAQLTLSPREAGNGVCRGAWSSDIGGQESQAFH